MVVDLTKTAQTGDMYYSWPQRMILPGYNPTTKAHGRVLSDAAKLFSQSYRPVLYVGGGAARSNAGAQVKALADLTGAPVVTTLPARGIIPDSDPKNLGMLGMHGTIAAALNKNDGIKASTVTLQDAEHGMTAEKLAETDVLIWWGHAAHGDVDDKIVERVCDAVWGGMGVIFLHSAHFSKPFKRLMGAPCNLSWREAG